LLSVSCIDNCPLGVKQKLDESVLISINPKLKWDEKIIDAHAFG